MRQVKILPISVTILICLGFLAKQVPYLANGHLAHFTDATSEQFIMGGARNFVTDGWTLHYGLPQYKGFQTETPVQKIRDTGVYTHFLPGPDYYMGLMYEIFGLESQTHAIARVIPMLHVFLAVLFLGWVCQARIFRGWAWGRVFLIGWIFLVPGIYRWSVSLFGHAFSTSYILIGLALGILCGSAAFWKIRKNRILIFSACFALGALGNLMFLESAFVVFAAPLVGSLLCNENVPFWRGFRLSFVVGLGLLFSYGIHFAQVAFFLESWGLAWDDQIGTALTRSEHREGPNRVQLIGRFSRHALGHFWTSALSMLALGSFFSWLHFEKRAVKLRRTLALVIAILAGYAFPMVLLHHSIIHDFRVPRLFSLLFFAYAILAVSLVKNRLDVHIRS